VRLRSFAAGCLLAPSVEGALNIQKKCYPCARSKTSPIFPLAQSLARHAIRLPRSAHEHALAHAHASREPSLQAARSFPSRLKLAYNGRQCRKLSPVPT
jgi:hypothetical protein